MSFLAWDEDSKLSARVQELSLFLREHALAVDADPSFAERLAATEELRQIGYLNVDERWNTHPLKVGSQKKFSLTLRLRARLYQELAYGDASLLLAAPGPAMAASLLEEMATETQREWFYSRLNRKPDWSFFALTEPEVGSDPATLRSELVETEDGLALLGEKKLVGNGHRGSLGVVFARTAPGPLGLRIALVEKGKGTTSTALPVLGLKGAGIAFLKFDRAPIHRECVLGESLRPTQRGLRGAIRSFNRYRPTVAAMALGIGRASLEELKRVRTKYKSLEKDRLVYFERELQAVGFLVDAAASAVDLDPYDGAYASVVKFRATRLAEEITAFPASALGLAGFLENPWLNKWYRDARALEFMEGVAHVHKAATVQHYQSGRLLRCS